MHRFPNRELPPWLQRVEASKRSAAARRMVRACRGRRLPALLVMLAAVWLPAVAAGSAAGASVPTCTASQLSAVYLKTTGAAGARAGEYGFENRTSKRCALLGYPSVQMLSASGSKLATSEQHTATGAFGITMKRVELAKNGVGYFAIEYHSQTGFGKLRCPASASLQLTAPGVGTPLLLKGLGGQIAAYAGTQAHLQCGVLRLSPVTAKRFQ